MGKGGTIAMDLKALVGRLENRELDEDLVWLYGADGLVSARNRALSQARKLLNTYAPTGSAGLFSGPGRTEIGGNHTDHQHGRVLCASVDLDVFAAAALNGTATVHMESAGYAPLTVDLGDLRPRESEYGSAAGLIRGVAAGVRERGYTVAGFDACAVSSVLSGSGLSSSAAFEVMVGNILNAFCCEGKLSPVEIAKIGQFAENVYFGKPCGLMDQMGSSIGGAEAIDFADPENPLVTPVVYDFAASGHALCVVDTRSDHAGLTGDYAAIPREMRAVAARFGKSVLREVDPADFRAALPKLRAECGDRAVLRAMHFFSENERAGLEAEALNRGDFAGFLRLVSASGLSSELLLQNVRSPKTPEKQAVSVALAIGRELLHGRGAIRVHGGGFAGTVQAFVPGDLVPEFKKGVEDVFGSGSCRVLRIRPVGGAAIV